MYWCSDLVCCAQIYDHEADSKFECGLREWIIILEPRLRVVGEKTPSTLWSELLHPGGGIFFAFTHAVTTRH